MFFSCLIRSGRVLPSQKCSTMVLTGWGWELFERPLYLLKATSTSIWDEKFCNCKLPTFLNSVSRYFKSSAQKYLYQWNQRLRLYSSNALLLTQLQLSSRRLVCFGWFNGISTLRRLFNAKVIKMKNQRLEYIRKVLAEYFTHSLQE